MMLPVRTGEVIARKYRVERVLGRGGMGVVVVAMHQRLRERVAIKFLRHDYAHAASMVARFVREGRAAMRIRSEHVVRVHDIGTLQTGEPFLVMEYLEGKDLAAVVAEEGRLSVEAAVEYALQAIEALAEAHMRGIVHRDLKPSNLFLSRRADGSPVVKVLDFGVAKNLRSDDDASMTPTEGAVGTPSFMAPEQMRVGAAVDARADIWSLGATLHVLLTGSPPFPPGSLVDIHEHIQRGPQPLRALRPDAPPGLEAALLSCMRPAPDERPADVAALAALIAPFGPDVARLSAERAARILSTGRRPDDPGDSEPDEGIEAPDTALAPVTVAPADASWGDASPALPETVIKEPSSRSSLAARSAPTIARSALWTRALVVAGAAGLIAWLSFTRFGASPSATPAAPASLPVVPQASAPVLVSTTAPSAPSAIASTSATAVSIDLPRPPASGSSAVPSVAGRPRSSKVLSRDPLADPD